MKNDQDALKEAVNYIKSKHRQEFEHYESLIMFGGPLSRIRGWVGAWSLAHPVTGGVLQTVGSKPALFLMCGAAITTIWIGVYGWMAFGVVAAGTMLTGAGIGFWRSSQRYFDKEVRNVLIKLAIEKGRSNKQMKQQTEKSDD